MDQKTLAITSKWILVLAGLSTGFNALTGTDLLMTVFGGFESIVDMVIGLAALFLAYVLLTKKAKK